MLEAKAGLVVGVELGGTKCICTIGIAPDRIIDQFKVATTTPSETLDAIVRQMQRWHKEIGFGAIGIASFGPLDLNASSPTYGRILRTAKPGWQNIDVLSALTIPFQLPYRLDTDVNAAAIAEQRWGSGQGADPFAYVTVGTGVGVGFGSVPGSAPPSAHAELGHLRVGRLAGYERSSVCPFHDDCVEGLASGRAIVAAMEDADIATVGYHDFRWLPAIDAIGKLCHAIFCTLGPCRIAFGGGVVVGNPGLVDEIEARTRLSLNNYLALPEERLIVSATLAGQAGPLGSLALASDALGGVVQHLHFRARA